MKITAQKKFLETLEYAEEQKRKHIEDMGWLLGKLYMAIPPEKQTAEIDKAFDILSKEFNRFENHPYDSFQEIMVRMLRMECNSQLYNSDNEYIIGSDWDKYCLGFHENRVDGLCGLAGGIIFHGFPESGYRENGSVQIEPAYGWQTHT